MLGIDIGSKSIKIIELNKSGTSWLVKSSGAVGYTGNSPDKAVDDNELKNISEIVSKMLAQIGATSKEVNIALPESLVFTRLIKFPMLSDEEVSAAVKWEAEQYIPIPVSEAVIQYSIIDRNEKKQQTSVLLVAAPKNIVEKYVKVIRLAGLTPVSAETELTALSRSLSPEKGTSMLLDIGSSATDMSVVKDGNIVFSRSIPVAGEAFTRSVSQGLGVTVQQAEEYKKTYGLDSSQLEGKVKTALDPVLKMVVDEIKKAIHFYSSENENTETLSSVVITGGASTMPNLVSYLTENLGIETVVGDPFMKMNLDPDTLKSLVPYASIYGTAVGLAMRED